MEKARSSWPDPGPTCLPGQWDCIVAAHPYHGCRTPEPPSQENLQRPTRRGVQAAISHFPGLPWGQQHIQSSFVRVARPCMCPATFFSHHLLVLSHALSDCCGELRRGRCSPFFKVKMHALEMGSQIWA